LPLKREFKSIPDQEDPLKARLQVQSPENDNRFMEIGVQCRKVELPYLLLETNPHMPDGKWIDEHNIGSTLPQMVDCMGSRCYTHAGLPEGIGANYCLAGSAKAFLKEFKPRVPLFQNGLQHVVPSSLALTSEGGLSLTELQTHCVKGLSHQEKVPDPGEDEYGNYTVTVCDRTEVVPVTVNIRSCQGLELEKSKRNQ
jgi:hypothetical protein